MTSSDRPAQKSASRSPCGVNSLRDPMYRVIDPVARLLVRMGAHPNAITVAGFLVTVGAAWLYSLDHVRTAGFMVLLGGLCDVFDGRVARLSGLASKFGSFFDSTLDRISEIAMYIGLMTLYLTRVLPGASTPPATFQLGFADVWMVYTLALALGGSLMVSYTRAKAESLGFDCSVGLMQRGERILLLGLGSLAFGLAWNGIVLGGIIVLVALLTNFTAIHRIVWVYRRGSGVPLDSGVGRRGGGRDRDG